MKEALAYIKSNYEKDLNMAMVSNHISMNYSFFSQTFKEYTGMSFVNYIKDVRINKAKELLESTNKKVAEIGYAVGYENEKHFMKVFRSVTGISPTEYRKNSQL
nr:AraC family transcriptional regulator [Holtiella tumoricola]